MFCAVVLEDREIVTSSPPTTNQDKWPLCDDDVPNFLKVKKKRISFKQKVAADIKMQLEESENMQRKTGHLRLAPTF